MPNDPGTKRTRPPPPHPEGFPAIDDAPVFLAPAVDVRPTSRARSVPPPPPSHEDVLTIEGTPQSEVPFTLPQPIEERRSALPPPHPERATASLQDPADAAPETIDWDRVSSGSNPRISVPGSARDAELSADVQERDAIARDLLAIGALDERADRLFERGVGARAALARARALRFRLSLLDAWPTGERAAEPRAIPSLAAAAHAFHLDLSLDAMLLVGLADGAPARGAPNARLPFVATIVDALRALRPDLLRSAVRERGASAIARLTVLGWKGALDQLARSALATPPEARGLALELAARVALVPVIDEHRLAALQHLERAFSLPVGSVAPAIEAARRRR